MFEIIMIDENRMKKSYAFIVNGCMVAKQFYTSDGYETVIYKKSFTFLETVLFLSKFKKMIQL